MSKINIVSYGGGVNSTAMVILMKEKGIKIDEVIFADTGNEEPETYTFLFEFKQWCKDKQIEFTTVKSHLGILKDYYYQLNLIPYRMFRSCTHKFKIIPINKYIKKKYPNLLINVYMGIASDEKHREKESRLKTQKMIYPLIELDITREKCKKIIKDENMTIPIKSGCNFCPFQTKKAWLRQLEKHPELYEENILFEENHKAFPKGTFCGISLRKLKEIQRTQTKLIDFDELKVEQCVYCHS